MAGHEPERHRVFRNREDDRDGRGGGLGGNGWSGAAMSNDDGDLLANQIGRQRRQSIKLVLGPAIIDQDVLTLDIAGVLEALAKPARALRKTVRRYCTEKADHRYRRLLHGGLLRARSKRARRRAAEQSDELPPPHVRLTLPAGPPHPQPAFEQGSRSLGQT